MHCSTSSVLAYPLPSKFNPLGLRIASARQDQPARSSHALCLLPGKINQLGPRIPSPRYRSTSSSSHTLCQSRSTRSVLAYPLPGKINQLGPHMPSAFCQTRSTSSVPAYPPPGTDPPACPRFASHAQRTAYRRIVSIYERAIAVTPYSYSS
ncbi:hypothetical protein CF319_g4221 [Tilletia indica]|nr:hypothetical protein CF319_g4221 [Tilletia indica]